MRSVNEVLPAAAPVPAELMRGLADAVTESGALALKMFRDGVRTWTKENDSPVSEADLAVDARLTERLRPLAPEAGWLSEETTDTPDRLERSLLWIVDPIDGTRSFIAGLPDWTIVAALVERGNPIAAAIFAPATEELFLATAGGGATRNETPIVAGTKASLDSVRIAGSRSIVERLARRHKVEKLPSIHSLALRLVRVATGEADAALAAAHAHDWDIAAADLIVREAGGLLTEFDGRVPQYNRPEPLHGVLAAAGRTLHPTLLHALADSLNKPDKVRGYAREPVKGVSPRE